MPVSRVLHLVLAKDVVGSIDRYQLIALVEAVGILVKVSASNQEQTSARHLNALKVVREVCRHLNLVAGKRASLENVLMDILRVSLEHEETLDKLGADSSIRLRECVDNLHVLILGPRERFVALTPLLVRLDASVGVDLIAVIAAEL